jgi:enoyl-[acyl-carrier protein] reductase II
VLKTKLCSLLGIEHPVIQGPLGGPFEVAELIAEVTKAGGMGSVATTLRTSDQVVANIRKVRELVGDKLFAVNFTRRPFSEENFSAVIAEPPAVISLALGEPGDLVGRAHDAGALFMQQVTTVRQAEEAAGAGVDVIVAQGGEAGGFSGSIGTVTLIPQVVDAVEPMPVVAAGGITDGRGLAAALMLGADGVVLGTRFLASMESGVNRDWKQAVIEAQAEDAVKVDFAEHIFPGPSEGGWLTVPRALRSPFIDRWMGRSDEVARRANELGGEVLEAMRRERVHEHPASGRAVGRSGQRHPSRRRR